MSLESRYSASDIIRLLNKTPDLNGRSQYLNTGNVLVYSYYENEQCIVLSPATDTVNHHAQMLPTISQGLKRLPELNKSTKKILIPVAQEQKILGLFKRNHWVTLQYDPVENKATVLDSRPWLVSFFYPMAAIKNELKQGINKLYGEKTAQTMRFATKYQGVQFNDIYCGAWTYRNILDLANKKQKRSIDVQKKIYSYQDEMDIVDYNITIVQATINDRGIPEQSNTASTNITRPNGKQILPKYKTKLCPKQALLQDLDDEDLVFIDNNDFETEENQSRIFSCRIS